MSTYLTRFSVRQRTEHALVMSLFIILSLTGLPQKYYDAAFARWMIDLMGGIDRIRWFHRAAGLSFTAMTALHLMFAIGSVAGGRCRLDRVPRARAAAGDARDPVSFERTAVPAGPVRLLVAGRRARRLARVPGRARRHRSGHGGRLLVRR
jgi:hypothetical protein